MFQAEEIQCVSSKKASLCSKQKRFSVFQARERFLVFQAQEFIVFQAREIPCVSSKRNEAETRLKRSDVDQKRKKKRKIFEKKIGVKKSKFANRPKRVLPKFRGDRSHVRGINGRSKFAHMAVYDRIRRRKRNTYVRTW